MAEQLVEGCASQQLFLSVVDGLALHEGPSEVVLARQEEPLDANRP